MEWPLYRESNLSNSCSASARFSSMSIYDKAAIKQETAMEAVGHKFSKEETADREKMKTT